MAELNVAVKLCECGCGKPAPIARNTNKRAGIVKGQPLRFAKNHSHRGKVVSAETRAKLAGNNSGPDSLNWKGEDVTYHALHAWLRKNYPKAGACDHCGTVGATEFALIRGREYSRDREDYRELCIACHRRYDNGTLFSDEEKADICRRYAAGESYPSLAAEYGVTRWVIGELVRGPRRHRKRRQTRQEQS